MGEVGTVPAAGSVGRAPAGEIASGDGGEGGDAATGSAGGRWRGAWGGASGGGGLGVGGGGEGGGGVVIGGDRLHLRLSRRGCAGECSLEARSPAGRRPLACVIGDDAANRQPRHWRGAADRAESAQEVSLLSRTASSDLVEGER